MWAVADYASKIHEETPLSLRLKTAFSDYLYRLRHFAAACDYEEPGTDAPWNLITLILYLAVAFTGFFSCRRHRYPVFMLIAGLFFVRSCLWMYILMGRRAPIRVVHGMLLVETCILAGILLRNALVSASEGDELPHRSQIILKRMTLFFAAVVMIAGLCYIPGSFRITEQEYSAREDSDRAYISLYDRLEKDRDSFYWIDVYTAVSYGKEPFSEKMFCAGDNYLVNHDYLGGWACKSPLQRRKMEEFKMNSIADSLLQDRVYMVIRTGSSTDWLTSYYNSIGIDVTVLKTETVAQQFDILKITGRQ
jgi:hypothetical protein